MTVPATDVAHQRTAARLLHFMQFGAAASECRADQRVAASARNAIGRGVDRRIVLSSSISGTLEPCSYCGTPSDSRVRHGI
jgi:tetrahydrodipicolinate N-succinyltransferase